MGEEVGLVAGDEDDASAGRHQRYSLQRKAPLGIAVEALRVPEVGANLRPTDALRIRVSSRPKRAAMVSIIAVDSASSEMSAPSVEACPPALRMAGNGFRTLGSLAVVHDNVGVGVGELLGDLGTDAPRSARDQDDPCRFVMHVGFLPSRLCMRFWTHRTQFHKKNKDKIR